MHTRTLGLALTVALGAACADAQSNPTDDVPTDTRPTDAGVTDAGTDVAPQQDVTVATDTPTDDGFIRVDGGTPDAALCQANNDGVITRAEFPYLIGASVIYQVNRGGTTVSPVDTVGTASGTGRLWDFSAIRAEDHRVLDEVLPATGQWWSAQVSGASFAAWIDRDSDVLGVYRATATALQLVATVSSESNRTLLLMEPAVDVVRFPLMEGSSWTQSVTGRGAVNFTPVVNLTQYTFRVDARGTARTPAGNFPVLRLRAEIDQSIPGTVFRRTQRSYVFATECFGVIARLGSVDNETAGEFTRASEYRRLGL